MLAALLLAVFAHCLIMACGLGNAEKHLYIKLSEDGYWKVGISVCPSGRQVNKLDRHPSMPELPPGTPLPSTVAIFYGCGAAEAPLLDLLAEKGLTVVTR